MSTWSAPELTIVEAVSEARVSSTRTDGTATPKVIIWIVRAGQNVYVRSVHGRDAGWFRATRATGTGHISIGGIEKDVTFTEITDPDEQEQINDAYRQKYRRFSKAALDSTLAPDALSATLKLEPR